MTIVNNISKPIFIKYRNVLVCLFLSMATIAVYWQVQKYDFVNLDDNDYVYDNRHVQAGLTLESIKWAFTTTHSSNWHPLTWLSHMMDCQLYGLNSGQHHLHNLFFHIANSLLLFFIFRKMTDSSWRSSFVAVLFALHPLHVESVAWVSERKDVLSTFFWMLTIWSYIWYVERPAVKRYLLVIVFLTLGLMSKPMLVTLPFVLLLLDFWPLCRIRFQKAGVVKKFQQRSIVYRLVLEKTPLFVLVAMSSAVTFYAQKHGGAVASLDVTSLKVRIANALVSYVKYIGKMVYPSKLAVLYPYSEILQGWEIIGACLLLVSISFLAIRTIKQKPYFAVGWLWYIGTLVPVIGLVRIGKQSMADRYTYVPLIGIFIIIAWGVPELVAQWRYRKIWLTTLATVFITILMGMTWKQVGYWKNSITLFEHTLKITSNNYLPHNNLGVALQDEGRIDEAIDHYLKALQINPYYEKAHYNLGVALQDEGRIDEAIDHYLKGLQINPDDEKAHYNLGIALQGEGRVDEAIDHYLKALQINPYYEKAHYNLGIALQDEGRIDEAIDHYLKALQINPDYEKAYYNLNEVLAFSREIDGNIDKIEKALKYKPNNPLLYCILGKLYRIKGKLDKAIEYYQKALSLQPKLLEAMYHLAKLFIIKMEYEKALSLYQEMIGILPNHPAAYYNIACIYARQNKPEKSVSWLKKAVEKGFDDWNHIKTDMDLRNIRGSSYYKDFIKGH